MWPIVEKEGKSQKEKVEIEKKKCFKKKKFQSLLLRLLILLSFFLSFYLYFIIWRIEKIKIFWLIFFFHKTKFLTGDGFSKRELRTHTKRSLMTMIVFNSITSFFRATNSIFNLFVKSFEIFFTMKNTIYLLVVNFEWLIVLLRKKEKKRVNTNDILGFQQWTKMLKFHKKESSLTRNFNFKKRIRKRKRKRKRNHNSSYTSSP